MMAISCRVIPAEPGIPGPMVTARLVEAPAFAGVATCGGRHA